MVTTCETRYQQKDNSMKKKILTVQFRHETNVFCPAPADEQAFRNTRYIVGPAVFEDQKGVGNDLSAFLDVFSDREDVELIPTVALYACPSGPVTEDVYDFVTGEVAKAIDAHGPVDAVFMDVHGAMVAVNHPDGEGDLMALIRSKVGNDIPVMAPLDLHTNITKKMIRHATALLPYESYPHVDVYDTGLAVAKLLDRTLKGEIDPKMACRQIHFQLPLFPTEDPAIEPLYRLAEEMMERPGVLHVRFSHGFYPADIEEVGMAAVAITDGDQALAEALAEELQQAIEKQIPLLKQHYMPLDEALDRALIPGKGPVVIADPSDNPGAGGLNDTTHILRRILERGITGACIATILDPESVKLCEKAGIGAQVELSLGGKSDPKYSGGPVQVKAKVLMITDGKYRNAGPMLKGMIYNHGTTAVVEVAGNKVLVSSLPKQVFDAEAFRKHGIAPEEENLLVVKSSIHYRASFGQFAREMIPVVVPGYAPPTPEGYTYKNWKD